MSDNSISKRLLWFAERVRCGVLFADIGTDHAKLPIYLVKNGIIKNAIASDIGEGPILHARTHIAANGLSEMIETAVGDGLSHLNLVAPADIAICGMGGKTIINILDGEEFVKSADVRLLLQPMTDFSELRRFLAENGFEPLSEEIVESDNRTYQCMILGYTGKKYALSRAEAELGTLTIKNGGETFFKYLKRRYQVLQKCYNGKMISGADVTEELELLAEYDKILCRENNRK